MAEAGADMARGAGEGIAEEGELFRTHIGGSALTEGVMMRGRLSWAVAARTPDGGIYLEEHEIPGGSRQAWRSWPLVRGCIAFVESMALAVRAMTVATEHVYDVAGDTFASLVSSGRARWESRARVASAGPGAAEEGPASGGQAGPLADDAPASGPAPAAVAHMQAAPAGVAPAPGPVPQRADSAQSAAVAPDAAKPSAAVPADTRDSLSPAMAASVVAGVVLGVVIFMAIPVGVANLLVGDYTAQNAILWNLVEAALRIAIFVAYIWGIGRMPEMARVFGYHGAEHLSIHCFEHGLPLTPANAAKFSRLHVRCGTAFLIMTMLVAIFVNTLVPVASLADSLGLSGVLRVLFVFASRLVLVPVVAGVSYEVTVRWAGSHPSNPLVRIVLWPGLQMQRLTTRVPDDGMLECAIAALVCVREREARAGIAAGEASS